MNIRLFTKGILLALVAILTECSDEANPENTLFESMPLSMVDKAIANANGQVLETENLPEWLSDYIDNMKPDNMRNVAAFQGKWKGESVYYVYDDLFSCILCATFNSDGVAIDWSKTDSKDFWKSSTDWEIVYLSKGL